MARKHVNLENITPATAGGTVTISCPVGPTYDRVTIHHPGIPRSALTKLEVEVGGKGIQDYADFDVVRKMNAFFKRHDGNGKTTLYFNRTELDDVNQRRVTGLGTVDVSTVFIKFKVAATVNNPSISATAVTSAAQPLGLITKVKEFPRNDSTGGPIVIDNLPRGPQIAAIALFGSDNVETVKYKLSGNEVIEEVETSVIEEFNTQNGRENQADALVLDFVNDNDIRSAIVTEGSHSQALHLKLADAGVLNVVVEYLDTWDGI